LSIKKQKQQHDAIIKLVESMFELKKRLNIAKLQTEKNTLLTRIEHTESEINNIVYQLYDLSPEEIEQIN